MTNTITEKILTLDKDKTHLLLIQRGSIALEQLAKIRLSGIKVWFLILDDINNVKQAEIDEQLVLSTRQDVLQEVEEEVIGYMDQEGYYDEDKSWHYWSDKQIAAVNQFKLNQRKALLALKQQKKL